MGFAIEVSLKNVILVLQLFLVLPLFAASLESKSPQDSKSVDSDGYFVLIHPIDGGGFHVTFCWPPGNISCSLRRQSDLLNGTWLGGRI